MDFLVGRQAILDRKGKVFGYELLYRENITKKTSQTNLDGDTATLRVIVNTFLSLGLNKIAKQGRIFINFTEDLIIEKLFETLPKERIVIEVLETVKAKQEVIEALKEAKRNGYTIALDDFVFEENLQELVKLADIIKIDFLELSKEEIKKELKKYKKYNLKLLAEKVETESDYKFALDLGFDYFQGFFFEKPEIESKKDISPYQANLLKALKIVNDPSSQMEDLIELISGDFYLHSKILALVNSPFFGLKTKITSVKNAVSLLGTDKTKKWLNILYISKLAENKPEELVILSTVRAKFASLLAKNFSIDEEDAYMLGMYSLIDSLLGVTMEKALSEFEYLEEEIKEALLGKDNRFRELLNFIELYEKGDFDKAKEIMDKFDLIPQNINLNYFEAVEFADSIYLL
ncbi:EAL and HDOD domain-containing protein [Hippea alviniae]|uniref:EAL and HDOD domain-containing protein n=1 Tax=Hippea alviniae TaxID=1279027 RepID=UPI0003B54A9C|nr:HDOD domain-containing protein [Hippea alviniae]